MEELIKQYGLVVLFIGTFAEGETILVIAGFLAHQGYLHLPYVLLTAFPARGSVVLLPWVCEGLFAIGKTGSLENEI